MAYDPAKKTDGHMLVGDPRHLLWRSHGCPFPTVPPWHWLVILPDAEGEFSPLRAGLVCSPTGSDTANPLVWEWDPVSYYSVKIVEIEKQDLGPPGPFGYNWHLYILTHSGYFVEGSTPVWTRKGNLDLEIEQVPAEYPVGQSPGRVALLKQRQWFFA